jgi:hypothetical protein
MMSAKGSGRLESAQGQPKRQQVSWAKIVPQLASGTIASRGPMAAGSSARVGFVDRT